MTLETQLDDLIATAGKRMDEWRTMLAALKLIDRKDPQGIGCDPHCECIGCIARRTLRHIEEAN